MVVRIRFKRGPQVVKGQRKNQRIALAVASLLTPVAAMASALALWRVAADLDWTSRFAISSGVFSHWQFWLAVAALIQTCAHLLNRYGKRGGPAIS